ncbi:MAG: hypothetical protein HEQ12_11050 [Aphanizomenon flos-aquae DEX188]|jgi:hypothetical protein|nr:MAG: hypothetical protein HEQ12_11050 [Aphanizomenon flos-aquae DEX188]
MITAFPTILFYVTVFINVELMLNAFVKNANIETLKKVFYFLPNKEKSQAIEELINDLES